MSFKNKNNNWIVLFGNNQYIQFEGLFNFLALRWHSFKPYLLYPKDPRTALATKFSAAVLCLRTYAADTVFTTYS